MMASRTAQDARERAEGAQVVFRVPLPPAALRGNSRAHWATRKAAADDYSRAIYGWWLAEETRWSRFALPAAEVEYEWRYAGARPDLDNVARGVKVLQDTLCCAPDVQSGYEYRHFLGLIENDNDIEPVTFRRTKVARRAEECVLVTIRPSRDGGTAEAQ